MQLLKKVFYIYSKQLRKKKYYYFIKFVKITLKKINRTRTPSYNQYTFNRLYNDYTLRTKKREKIKNYYLNDESESYPFYPKLENSGYFPFSTRVIPSIYNYGKKYYNPKSNYFNKNYTSRRNITENYKNNEGQKNNNKDNMTNKKAISSKINKDINENLFQYLTNPKIKKRPNILSTSNLLNQKSFFPNKTTKISITKKALIKSKSKSKSKTKNDNKNLTNNELFYCTTKSVNPSTLSGVEHLKTNYTNQQNTNNIKSTNAVLSNNNSASSRINGLKRKSGINEYFYDFNSGKKRYNSNNNINNEQKDLSLQTISDSKILEIAGKYVNDEDNSSENYHMNNVIYSKKKYINKKK